MAIDNPAPRSRRAILTGALGGAGVLLASSLGRATTVSAATGDPLLLGKGVSTSENATSAPTILNADADHAFVVKATPGNSALEGWTSFGGTAVLGVTGIGLGVHGLSGSTIGVYGRSGGGGVETINQNGRATGVIGTTGDNTTMAPDTDETGVYGFANNSTAAVGVWGDSVQGTGVVGSGDWGVYGTGSVGVVGDASALTNGVYGFSGNEPIVAPIAQAGVLGTGGTGGGVGVRGHAGPGATYGVIASAAAASQYALFVSGKLRLSRSGRVSMTSRMTSKVVSLAGVTTASYIVATLQTSVTGCYVRAVVPGANSFRIYLSKAPGKTVAVGYVVVN